MIQSNPSTDFDIASALDVGADVLGSLVNAGGPSAPWSREQDRRFVAAFNARDVESLIACFAPSIEYHSAFAAVGGAVYHGHDGLRRWHRDLAEAWGDEIRAEPETYFDLGEHTLAFPGAARARTAKRCKGRAAHRRSDEVA